MSDYAFLTPCYEVADWVIQQRQAPVYVYLFNHTSAGTVPLNMGVYHAGKLLCTRDTFNLYFIELPRTSIRCISLFALLLIFKHRPFSLRITGHKVGYISQQSSRHTCIYIRYCVIT